MQLLSLPRHQIEATLSDYARIAASLVGSARRENIIADFERAFTEYVGCRHAIAVSSGRLGIHLILEALGLQPGDEVIVPAFNLFAVVERFCQLGLAPRFADIRREDLNIDEVAVERLVTARSRVLLVTHMFGHPADMDSLIQFAKRNNLILLEDCAHALGSKFAGKFVGTFGRAAIFSFSVLKLVTTFGGGMIATNDDNLARSIRRQLSALRFRQPRPAGVKKALMGAVMDFGTRKMIFSFGAWPVLRLLRAMKPNIQRNIMTEAPRYNRQFDPQHLPPLHPFQARLGRSQLARAEEFIERRRAVGRWLDVELADIPQVTRLTPNVSGRHNGLYYGILVDRPAELSAYLFRRGIDSETSEYLNCADLAMYRDHYADCPVAREVQSRILRLPNYPSLTRGNVARIARTISTFYTSQACLKR